VNSALYEGRVRHHRIAPFEHRFEYGLFWVKLDLAELDSVFAGHWLWSTRRPALAWFRRADFLGDPALPLDVAVRDLCEARLGRRPSGRIAVLTHLRYYGLSFNPVSFYFCEDEAGRLDAIVAEITNTPWLERHAYVLDGTKRPAETASTASRFAKEFHVSPFLPMDCEYAWRFDLDRERIVVHMENWRAGVRVFTATMNLARQEIGSRTLAQALLRHPFQSARVVLAIYWQALVLRLKGAPFFGHPSRGGDRPLPTNTTAGTGSPPVPAAWEPER
jgi:DUF1365 family protein